MVVRGPFAAIFALSGCSEDVIHGGDRALTVAACERLCVAQKLGDGCVIDAEACFAGCVTEADTLGERCLLAGQTYYECAAEEAWACPAARDRPETEGDRCAAEAHARLVCAVTRAPP